MGKPLKTPPVCLTLAQVRFNTILKLADFLPSIQENFRLAGYPDYLAETIFSIKLATPQDGQPPAPVPVQQERYRFGNVEKTHVFILEGQSLTLLSTNYGTYRSFSDRFLEGLGIVHAAVTLAFMERVGLRYIDRVMPQEGDTIESYLVAEAQGLNSLLGGEPLYSFTETRNAVDNVKLVSRALIMDGPLAFPPDIQPWNMEINGRFTEYVGKSAILDNDGFVEDREVFSTESVAGYLDIIHKVIGTAFKATVTPYAFKVWDQ